MLLRLLSIGGPLWLYATIVTLLYGLFLQRKRFEWIALALGAGGVIASGLFLAPIHRLFFDEDIYINVASNLTHAPVNQMTVAGGPQGIQISTYPKEPAGWPVLLSFAFLVAGAREAVAFGFARLLFGLAIAAVYHFARALLPTRGQAVTASVLFAATPICFWYSASAGTDMTAALMAVLGMWGLATGNGPLAGAGFAFAAQTRMELLLLLPLVWISSKIPSKWKIAAAALALFEILHVTWVMSVAPELERAEAISSAFGVGHVWTNLVDNVKYLVNPFAFPIAVSVFATLSLWERAAAFSGRVRVSGLRQILRPSPGATRRISFGLRPIRLALRVPEGEALAVWFFGLFVVYLCFYAGSFDTNTRYSIQIVAPLVILATSLAKRPVWMAALLLSAVIPATQHYGFTPYMQALEADHQLSLLFASRLGPNDLMVSGVQEIFIDNGARSINAAFASMNKDRLDGEIRQSRDVWYHANVRSNYEDSDEWRADRWMKSNYELHPIDSHEVGGFTIAFYKVLLKGLNRDAR